MGTTAIQSPESERNLHCAKGVYEESVVRPDLVVLGDFPDHQTVFIMAVSTA
jgi:hypothetical protein